MIRRAVSMEPDRVLYLVAEAALLEAGGLQATQPGGLAPLLARARHSGDAGWNNQLCWYGAVAGFAPRVLPACELACSLAPESGSYRDSRGLARALAGDIKGASEDFRFALDVYPHERDRFVETRTAWLRKLEAGQDPFDEEQLQELENWYFGGGC